MSQLERNFIIQMCQDMEKLNGTEFEYFSKKVLSMILNEDINQKGHNLYAKPVKSTADFNTNNFEIVGQCGTDNEYFKFPAKATTTTKIKPIKDIEGAIKNHPQSKTIYLFANQVGTGGLLSKLNIEIAKYKYTQDIKIYDAEKITDVILENILNQKIEIFLQEYLPTSYEVYKLLPQANNIPKFTSKKYFERDVEDDITEKLLDKKVLQIFGISGLGKTEIVKNISIKLSNKFESSIWINGDDLNNNFNFESIHISKFNSNVNLKNLLENYKIVLILDNLNDNLNELKDRFDEYNKKGSVCLITSLQSNLANNSYSLNYLSDENSKNILFEIDDKPSESVVNDIVSYIDGYPLLLTIIRDTVDNKEYTWEEVLEEIKDAVNIDDPEKNQKISIRILEKQLTSVENEINWIYFLETRFISKEFLKFCIKKSGINKLLKRSIIAETDSSFYTIHQIILDSIIDILKSTVSIEGSHDRVSDFLLIENEKKSVGYFNFLFRHGKLIEKIYSNTDTISSLKKQILYAKIQSTHENNKYFIEEINKLNLDEDIKINILLFIEKIEMEVFEDKNNKEFREEKIELLKSRLSESKLENIDTYINHHLGKLYITIDKNKALSFFNKVLENNSNADYTKLQIARILSWDKKNNNYIQLNNIFSTTLLNSRNWKEESLSVLLALYDVLTQNNLFELRKKYIYDDIDNFIEHLFYALSFESEQSLQLLANLSRNLKYDKRDEFIDICERLPLDISSFVNKNIKYSYAVIYTNYYKVSKQLDNENIDKIFYIAKETYMSLDLNDYQRGNFVSLYIYSKDFQSALKELDKYEKKDAFFYQKLCQIKRGLTEYEESLEAIEEALTLNQKYKSDFLNDKAKTLFQQGNKVDAIKVLDNAIQEELNSDIKISWNKKLETWKKEI